MGSCDLKLGVVGLGALGRPMAANLISAGFDTRLHNRTRSAETGDDLDGAVRCANPAEASAGVDVLLLCVSDDTAVETVLFGDEGASAGLNPGSCLLYTSPSPRD